MSDHNSHFAKLLSEYMAQHNISSSQYAITAGYCVGQITGRQVTDLDVILSKVAYIKLKASNDPRLCNSITEISKTEKITMLTTYGEIEFFEREDTGFPSDTYSLKNMLENKMLDCDEFGNPYMNVRATIEHYAEIECGRDGELVFGGNYIITKDRLEKNIQHLKGIREKMVEPSEYLDEQITRLGKL